MRTKNIFILTVAILCMVMVLNVKAQPAADSKESARVFVQKFYDWYVPVYNMPLSRNKPGSVSTALAKRKDVFDAILYKALLNYLNTPPVEELDGLDSDPFLSGQDVGRGYQVGNVKQVGNKYFVDIHNIEKGKSAKAVLAAEILVVPEVEKINGKWVFTNFTFPFEGKRYDLLIMLNNIQKQRNLKKGQKT